MSNTNKPHIQTSQHVSQVKNTEQSQNIDESVISFYGLYEFKGDDKESKLELMIYYDQSKPIIVTMNKILVEIGNQKWNIFHCQHQGKNSQNQQFMIKIQTNPHYKIFNDYYEKQNKFRKITNDQAQFIFDLKIENNDSNYYYKVAPGKSILDKTLQLIFYSAYLLNGNNLTHLKILFGQFEEQFQKILSVPQNFQQYAQVFDQLIDGSNDLPTTIQYILQIHSFLPSKLVDLQKVEFQKSSEIIFVGKSLVQNIFNDEFDNESILENFKSNRIIKGFLVHQLINKNLNGIEWLHSINTLQQNIPIIVPTLLKHLLEIISTNSLSLNLEEMKQIQIIIKKIEEEKKIYFFEQFELLLILSNMADDIDCLFAAFEELLNFQQQNIEWESEVDLSSKENVQKLRKVLDHFFKEKIKSLENFSTFTQKFSQLNDQIKKLFYQSQISLTVKNSILRPYPHKRSYLESELNYLRIIFIEAYDSQLLEYIEFNEIADNLKLIPFITQYLNLFLEKDDIQASQISVMNFITQKVYQFQGTFKLLKDFDNFLMEIKTIHQDHLQQYQDQNIDQEKSQKFQEFENYISDQIFQAFNKILIQYGNQLINWLYDFSTIQSQNLQHYYQINMQKIIYNKIQNRNDLENILKQILQTQKRFKSNKNEVSKLITSLLNFVLNLIDEKPTQQKIMRQLIDDPSKDHNWYFLIQNYEEFINQELANHIIQYVSELGIQIVEKNIKIEELLKLKNQSNQKKESFDSYLTLALMQIYPNILQNKTIRQYIDEIQQELQNTLDTIDQLRTFFVDILCLDQNQVIMKDFNEMIYDYPKKIMKDFVINSQFEQYKQMAKKTSVYRFSSVFHKYLNNQKKNQNLSIDDLQKSCQDAIDCFQKDINEILTSDLQVLKVSKIISLFGNIDQFDREIEIIFNQNQFSEIKKILNMLGRRKDFLKLCQGIIDMSKFLNLNFKNEIQLARNYLDQNQNQIQQITCKEYSILHKNILMSLWTPIETQGQMQQYNEIISAICSFSHQTESLINFIRSCKLEDLEQLKDYVNDYDEEYVSTQNIISIYEYISSIDTQCINPDKNYINVVNQIKKNLNDPKFKSLSSMTHHCTKQLPNIIELKKTLESKEEAKKQQILAIMKQSSFELISPNKKGFWTVELEYQKCNKSWKFNRETIGELRDRALLIQQQIQEQMYMEYYVKLANSILQILQSLDKLYQNGYPGKKIFQKQFEVNDANFDDFLQEEKRIYNLQEEWEKNITDAYQKNYWLTLMSGRNFWKIEKYFQGNANIKTKKKAENILMFMNKSCKNLPAYQKVEEQNLSPFQRLINICQRLDKIDNIQIDKKKISHEVSKLSNIPIQEKSEFFFIENRKPFLGILSLYINSNRTFPRADQILFCSENTSYQEILSFLYRCILSPQTELHCIVKPEQLSLDIQDKLTNLTIKILQDQMTQTGKFYLGIITTDSRSYVSKFFRKHSQTKIIKDSQILNENQVQEIVSQIDTQTWFVSSKTAGLGKTHYIKELAKTQQKELIFFPIAGQINHDEIGKRLQEIELNKPSIFAIQVSYVVNFNILNELLIDIALLRVFQTHNDIFILPPNCSIYIEISNSFDNLLKKEIFYRNYVQEHYIDEFKLDNLTTNPNDDIQFVCNNLLLFKDRSILKEEINKEKLKPLVKEQCIGLLNEFFVKRQKDLDQEPNYIQLSIYIKILKTLFENFQKCPFFWVWQIEDQIKDCERNGMREVAKQFKNIRETVFDAILITVQEFTLKSINRNVGKIQNNSIQFLQSIDNNNGDQQEEQNYNEEQLELENNLQITLTWESSNHFNIIFVEDGSLLFIYKDPIKIPQNIQKLIYIQANAQKQRGQILQINIQQNNFEIENLSKFSHDELKDRLQVLKVNSNSIANKKIEDSYVLTTDNFLKMNVIYLRIQARIPVIIMGETGCGKTSLIRYFCYQIRNEELEIFNIHAGVTSDLIRNKMHEYTRRANDLLKENKNLWVFFDEFNTTENIGLICEMLTERTLLGQEVPQNMRFIAACNPYRLRTRKIRLKENVGIKKQNQKGNMNLLTYSVYPLPENITLYVYDFGKLNDNDTEKYIQQMLKNNSYLKRNQFLELITKMLMASQQYFQQNEDSSSVSLRDISRFIIIFEWFNQSFKFKKIQNCKSDIKLEMRACILALCHCYYLRISSIQERKIFLEKICSVIIEHQQIQISVELILQILNEEQDEYINRMELTSDIARNQALKENVFAIIPCILNKVPIFICGKPGCSKSLAISLIFSSLKGKKSQNEFFRQFPELTMVSFQGSDSCTSDGILQAYERAKKLKKNDQNILPVLVFDEIGLAELSKHNPLKVLHSLFEVENREIGFVGISNWRLDASKMNRAVYLARPDPEQNDLEFTAISIYKSICSNETNQQLIKDLATAYFQLKNHFKENLPEYADFYGLRDFYHLIKQVSRGLKENLVQKREDVIKLTKRAVERNFGGKIKAAQRLGELFSKQNGSQDIYQFQKSEDILDLIGENLLDKYSRYLMLICRQDIAQFILEKKFQKIQKSQHQLRTIVGSNFEKDLNEEQYGFSSLSDVILYIERGTSIILKDMEHIYSSLYDLFNQNFAMIGDRKYCRIALGAIQNPKCYVHDDFRSIIFMKDNEDILKKADAPFLNRFEKHYIELDSLINENQRKIIQQIQFWIKQLLTLRMDKKEEQIQLKETNIFPNYNDDNLRLIILDVLENSNQNDDQEIQLRNCKIELIRFATQDIIILANISIISEDEKNFIIKEYEHIHKENFQSKIDEQMIQDPNYKNKLIAMSYSGAYQLSQNDEKVLIRSITYFKSEQELVKTLKQFYGSQRKKVFIIEIDYQRDKEHINFIKFIVEKVESEVQKQQNEKQIILLIHMQRNFNELGNSSLSMYNGWEQKIYYDISEANFQLSDDLMKKNLKNLILDEEICSFKDILASSTEKSLLKFQFEEQISKQDQEAINENILNISEKIIQDEQLVAAFKQKIYKYFEEKQERTIDWKYEICLNKEVIGESINVKEAIKKVIEIQIEKRLTSILYILEKNSAFMSYFTDYEYDHGKTIRKIWIQILEGIQIDKVDLQKLSYSNYMRFTPNLKFPFSRLEQEVLMNIQINQKKYEEQDENINMKDPLEYFIDQFQDQSKIGPNISEIETNETLQLIYFGDIYRLFLIDNLIDLEYEPIIHTIVEKIMENKDQFMKKLKTFLMMQQQFLQICEILKIYHNLMKIPFQVIQKFIKDQFKLNEDWYILIEGIFDQFITNIQLNQISIIVKDQSIQSLYERFYAKLASFNGIDPKNLIYLKFWNDLIVALDLNQEQEKQFLFQVFEMSQKLGQQNEVYLLDRQFIDKLISYFEAKQQDKSIKFLTQFFSIIVKLSDHYVYLISDKLELDQYKDVFKHGSILLQNLLSKMDIQTQLDQFINPNPDNIQENFDAVDLIIDFKRNGYIKQIDLFLQNKGIDCKLGVILSDIFINKYFKTEFQDDTLLQYYNTFKQFINIFNRNDIDETHFPYLQRLTAISFIKSYLDIYIKMICKGQNISSNGQNEIVQQNQDEIEGMEGTMNDIDDIICNSKIRSTLQLYCLKKIKQLSDKSSEELKTFIKDKMANYQWPKQCNILDNNDEEKIVDHLPIVDFLQDQEIILLSNLNNIIKLNDKNSKAQIKISLEQKADTEKKIIIGLAFLKVVFLKHACNQKYNFKNLQKFFTEELEEILEQRIGLSYTALIKQFILNFPGDNILKLKIDMKQEQIHQRIMFCFILILVFSHSQTPNSISGQFFTEDGKFDIKKINQSFLLGQEPDFQHDYLLNLLNNYDTLKNRYFMKAYSKGGTYACGQDGSCDYVYFVSNCGGQVEKMECPWCKRRIGVGEKQHTNFPREGHNNLTDDEAIAYLKKLVEKYENDYKAGYYIINSAVNGIYQTINGLNPTTWRLLRIFTHLTIYFMLICGGLTEEQFYTIIAHEKIDQLKSKPKQFLQQHLKNDVQIIFNQISNAGSDCQAPWLHYILIQMIPIFQNQKENLTNLSLRKKMENLIDQEIIIPNISKVAQIAQQQRYKLMHKSEIGQKLIQEIWVNEIKESYKYLKLFRLTKDTSFNDMRTNFYSNPKNFEQFKILKILFDNYDDIKRLKQFYPIIDFTTKLMHQCDHMITRIEAREKKMKDYVTDQNTKDLFDKFLKAWKQLDFNKLQYMCHQLNYRKNYDDNTEIINFLIDDKEKGGGMCMAAAICQLTSLHNSILEDCIKACIDQGNLMSQNIVDQVVYPIQKIKQNHLLDVKIDSIDMISSTSLNNIEYGYGQELVYDFGRIQLNLMKEILNKKLLRSDQLQFIQYQLELVNLNGERSALIIDIRNKYKQKNFQQDIQNLIHSYLTSFENKSMIEMQKSLKQLFGSLEKFLCFLLNLQAPNDKINETIGQLCQKYSNFKIDERFKDKTILSKVQLFNIVSLYEQIEMKIFPHIETSLNNKFMIEYDQEIIQKKIQDLLDLKETSIPSRKQIEIAIMRFIIRCLAADLDEKQPLKYYIFREDFWDENIDKSKLEGFEEFFPDEIHLDRTYCTYKIIKDLNSTSEKRQQSNTQAKATTTKNPSINKPSTVKQTKKTTKKNEDKLI